MASKESQETSNNTPTPVRCAYELGSALGKGTYAEVREAIHIASGQRYAVKIINKRLMAGREHMVRNEIAVLKRISQGHENVLTLVDYFETTNSLYLVTDLATGGELFDKIVRKGAFYESDSVDILIQILLAVIYLHQHGIVHRDLKPENVLFRTPDEDADLLLADFGLSRIIDEEKFRILTTTCGTPGYMAPEVFKKSGYGKAVDMWAIGIITYFMLCGYTPFDRDSPAEEREAVMNGDYAFEPEEYWEGVSEDARDFIRKCLEVDPSNRLKAEDALKHPFILQSDKLEKVDLLPTMIANYRAKRDKQREKNPSLRIPKKLPSSQAMDGCFSTSPQQATKPFPPIAFPPLDAETNAKDAAISASNSRRSSRRGSNQRPLATPARIQSRRSTRESIGRKNGIDLAPLTSLCSELIDGDSQKGAD